VLKRRLALTKSATRADEIRDSRDEIRDSR
jgi:hypothetical protein